MTGCIATIDEIEASFLSNIEKGEQALAAAEDDYQRLEVRDAARAAQVVVAAMGRRQLVRRFSILVQRAERAIAQANPPQKAGRPPTERTGTGLPEEPGEIRTPVSEFPGATEIITPAPEPPAATAREISRFRAAHEYISDDEFEKLANTDTDEPMTRQGLIEIGRERRREQREEDRRQTAEAAATVQAPGWTYTGSAGEDSVEAMLREREARRNAIGVADAIELLRALPDQSVDLLLTDIPYAKVNKSSGGLRVIDKAKANEETFDLETFAEEVIRVTKYNAVIFCGKEQFSTLYQHFDEHGLATRMIVWEKTNPSPMNGEVMFLSGVECAVHFRKRRAPFNERHQNTVFRFPSGNSLRHPTEKPLDLFRRFVEILTDPDSLVCDPCMGSGTAAVAAQLLGRRFLCSDISPENGNTTHQRLLENRQPGAA